MDNSNATDNHEVQKRHYQLLQREMNKKKPDEKVVNIYLNKEFHMRRDWLQKIPAEKRCQMVLHSYPCFSDHVEVQYTLFILVLLLALPPCLFKIYCSLTMNFMIILLDLRYISYYHENELG